MTGASLVPQMVKNLPVMKETWVQSLGREDPLEKGMATHSSILAWTIAWTEGPGGLQSVGFQRVRFDWVTNTFIFHIAIVVQLLSRVQLFATSCTAACQAFLSTTNSWSLLKLMFIELVMPSNHLILCRPLLLLPSIFPSIGVFSNQLVLCIRWPEYWSFSSASVLAINIQG